MVAAGLVGKGVPKNCLLLVVNMFVVNLLLCVVYRAYREGKSVHPKCTLSAPLVHPKCTFGGGMGGRVPAPLGGGPAECTNR